ncbi:hypothetical protein FE257_009667 [Aspergillus nanangensis]|uniref:Uncharacterized protein n=1 Tax=Aspergillus nanangensis TaxID=2582783 RepID=A0AAD4GRS3_ASPNN|nr:hypothetical protein FE257_009667 [Aspergillus nanangensis]
MGAGMAMTATTTTATSTSASSVHGHRRAQMHQSLDPALLGAYPVPPAGYGSTSVSLAAAGGGGFAGQHHYAGQQGYVSTTMDPRQLGLGMAVDGHGHGHGMAGQGMGLFDGGFDGFDGLDPLEVGDVLQEDWSWLAES